MGTYQTSSGNNTEALVLTETIGTWATGVELSLPADAATFNQVAALGSISCASVGNCTAVGVYQFMSGPDSWASQGLLVSETAGSWGTGVAPSLPANAWTPNPQAGLSSVSCASAGNCTAVGEYSNNSPTTQGLLLTQTGGTWATGVEAPLPANAETSAPGSLYSLNSVSCASAGNCSAVGAYLDNSINGHGLLLTETAGSWATGVDAALPADAATDQQFVLLRSVSCPTAGNCSAVGGYTDSSGGGDGLLLTQTAGTWGTGTEVSAPSNASPSIDLTSISCPSAQTCSGGGDYGVNLPGNNRAGLLLATTGTTPEETLTLSAAGSGSGTVTSSPAGIDCGATCSFKFPIGSEVALTATPAHSIFSSWSVGSCNSDILDPCQVAMSSDTAVTATFNLNLYEVTVQKSGPGLGTVVSTTPDSQLNCGPVCAVGWEWGSQVTLVESPAAGSVFAGWSGAGCSGNKAACQLTDTADTTVTATFAKAQCIVPKVIGKSLSSAKASIFASYCGVGHVKKKASKKVRKGRVISQSPSPGRHLTKGSKINLVVSKGR